MELERLNEKVVETLTVMARKQLDQFDLDREMADYFKTKIFDGKPYFDPEYFRFLMERALKKPVPIRRADFKMALNNPIRGWVSNIVQVIAGRLVEPRD